MISSFIYHKYSDFLKQNYKEKVYKLPINLPVSCPNRENGQGCTFCSDMGTGFESLENSRSVKEQIRQNKAYIGKRYHAHKFIAYFQNYTNTFLPLEKFKEYMIEAALEEDIVELSISTRPDCIRKDYLDVLQEIHLKYQVNITIELGLQTVNYHSLISIHRGHTLAEFIDSVLQISSYPFLICTHVILNLPGDTLIDAIETSKVLSALPVHIVKIHSLYVAKNTWLSKEYERGTITICDKEEYMELLIGFIEHLRTDIVIERLFSRVPEEESIFSNWGISWWKLQDEFYSRMDEKKSYQGISFNYLNGSGLRSL